MQGLELIDVGKMHPCYQAGNCFSMLSKRGASRYSVKNVRNYTGFSYSPRLALWYGIITLASFIIVVVEN